MAFDDAGLHTIGNSDVRYTAVPLIHPPVTAKPVTAFHILGRPGKEQLAKAQAGHEHIGLVDLAGLDLVPLDRVAGVIDFNALPGLELARGDGRLAVLRELAIKLLPEV